MSWNACLPNYAGMSNAAEPVEITLRRGDQIVELSYRPAGPKVRATQWERDPKVPPEQCVTF